MVSGVASLWGLQSRCEEVTELSMDKRGDAKKQVCVDEHAKTCGLSITAKNALKKVGRKNLKVQE